MKNAKKWNLYGGFTLLGYSQGSIVARQILQDCEIGLYARRLIAVGGPLNGIIKIPTLKYTGFWKFVNNASDYVIYNSLVQKNIAPGGYYKSLKHHKAYLQRSNTLRYLNNEVVQNEQYRNRIL